jgi:hypothetical protein
LPRKESSVASSSPPQVSLAGADWQEALPRTKQMKPFAVMMIAMAAGCSSTSSKNEAAKSTFDAPVSRRTPAGVDA